MTHLTTRQNLVLQQVCWASGRDEGTDLFEIAGNLADKDRNFNWDTLNQFEEALREDLDYLLIEDLISVLFENSGYVSYEITKKGWDRLS
jgi:hypothetical protein